MRELVRRWADAVPIRDDRYGTVYELVNPQMSGSRVLGLAYVEVDPLRESPAHYHELTEEAYFIISGEGVVRIDGQEHVVLPGAAVYIPPRTVHSIRNTGGTKLAFLSADAPPYSSDDDYET